MERLAFVLKGAESDATVFLCFISVFFKEGILIYEMACSHSDIGIAYGVRRV